jgi:hypothetical protein
VSRILASSHHDHHSPPTLPRNSACHCPAVRPRRVHTRVNCNPARQLCACLRGTNATASIPRATSIVARFTPHLPRVAVCDCAHAAHPQRPRLHASTVAHHHAESREPVSGEPEPRSGLAPTSPSCSGRPPPYRYCSSSPFVCCCCRPSRRPSSPASPSLPTAASTSASSVTARMASATAPWSGTTLVRCCEPQGRHLHETDNYTR